MTSHSQPASRSAESTDLGPDLMPPTVLILGANGRLGAAAAQAFDAAGWRVLAQVRRERDPALPAGAQLLHTSLSDLTLLAAQAHGAQVVLHALNPRYGRWQQEALPLMNAGIALAERLKARLLLPGNVYAWGESMPARLSPATPMQPSTPHGRVRLEMEQAMARRCERGTLRAAVLTAGDFFGAGRGTWFDQAIVASLNKGRLAYPGPLDLLHAWAYLPDLARAFVALAQAPSGAPFERFMFGGHTLTGRDLLDATERVAQSLGLASAAGLRRRGMPWGLIRAVGLVNPTWRALAQMSYLWRVPHALDDSTLRERVGVLPATPLDAALRAALRALSSTTPLPGAARGARPGDRNADGANAALDRNAAAR